MIAEFLQLPGADLESWREMSITKAFIKLLELEQARCADTILAEVRRGKSKEAEILSGKLEAIGDMITTIMRTEIPTGETEEPFIDPAARRNA